MNTTRMKIGASGKSKNVVMEPLERKPRSVPRSRKGCTSLVSPRAVLVMAATSKGPPSSASSFAPTRASIIWRNASRNEERPKAKTEISGSMSKVGTLPEPSTRS